MQGKKFPIPFYYNSGNNFGNSGHCILLFYKNKSIHKHIHAMIFASFNFNLCCVLNAYPAIYYVQIELSNNGEAWGCELAHFFCLKFMIYVKGNIDIKAF